MLNNNQNIDLSPPHPGEILRDDMLPRLQLGAAGLAGRLGLPLEVVTGVLTESRPMTADIAAKLAATFGHSVRFWIGLQCQYDRWHAGATTSIA